METFATTRPPGEQPSANPAAAANSADSDSSATAPALASPPSPAAGTLPLFGPRGPLSALVLATVQHREQAGSDLSDLESTVAAAIEGADDVVFDDDIQLSLLVLYSLSYGGVVDNDDEWEWNPDLIRARTALEHAFEGALRDRVPQPPLPLGAGNAGSGEAVAASLFELTAPDNGPSLSRYVARQATAEQLVEFVVQRSVYTLKEADAHSWGIPKLTGRAKAALVEIQADEYGGGSPERVHQIIFAGTMRALGLDDRYGAYIDNVPAITLASFNMMTMFGFNRRLRGALAGHLAAFEMTSSIPCRMYGNGFRRLGFGSDVTGYFDEHVEADAVHEQIAAHDLAGSLAEDEPDLLDDIMFGASACLTVDGWAGQHILDSWTGGRSSLRKPLP